MGVTFAAEPLHAGEATGTGGVCGWGEESLSPLKHRGSVPPKLSRWRGSPRAPPPGHYPCHSVRRGSPRPPRARRSTRTAGWLRAGSPRSGHPGPSASRCLWCCLRGGACCLTRRAHTCTPTRRDPAYSGASGSPLLRGASHLSTRCRRVPGGCRGRTRRRRSRPGCGTRRSHTDWTGTRRCLQGQPPPSRPTPQRVLSCRRGNPT